MSDLDIHKLSFSGTYGGVPIAIGMAYQQDGANPPVVSAGRDLIESWFSQPAGPWANIREELDQFLIFQCAVDSFGEEVDTVFLVDANGENIGTSLPPTHSIQMNIPALFPHPDGHEGRFFLPGIPSLSTFRSGYSQALASQLVVFAAALLEIDSINGGGVGLYKLIPHAEYRNSTGGTSNIQAFLPYNSEFVKVIGNRRADQCGAFAGGGGGFFNPITVPPIGLFRRLDCGKRMRGR